MEKFEQSERVFSHFDSDSGGRISPEKLRQCVASIGGDMVAAEAEVAVALTDSEGDGLLSLEDFVKVVEGAGEEEKQSGGVRPLRAGRKRVHYSIELEENAMYIGAEKKCSRLQEYDRPF